MDMLGDPKMRNIVNHYFEESGEQDLVRKAVSDAWSKEHSMMIEKDDRNILPAKLRYIQPFLRVSVTSISSSSMYVYSHK